MSARSIDLSALQPFIDAIADALAERLTAGAAPAMLDQSASPLGRRRHIAAVRKLVASGAPGAAIVGRRYLLSREALESALAAQGSSARGKRSPAPVDDLADMRARYGLSGGTR